jgi:adenine-specific DNA-methyltransferase
VVCFQTTSGFKTKTIATLGDFLLWYAKDRTKLEGWGVRKLYQEQPLVPGEGNAKWVLLPDGSYRGVSAAEKRGEVEVPEGARFYNPGDLQSQGAASQPQPFEYEGKVYEPGVNSHWKANYPVGIERLAKAGRIHVAENSLRYRRFAEDFPYQELGNIWTDTLTGSFTETKIFAVQTNPKVIERCMLMATDPGDLVLDITCGGGTTAVVAEQWGRRWITCDTSRVATTLAKQRLMTSTFDYYQLAQPDEGVGSGFRYESVSHITLEGIANNEPPAPRTLYDRPVTDPKKTRVTGPFTVEAVPAPAVKPLEEIPEGIEDAADESVARKGETLRQSEWRDELLKTGIRGKGGQHIEFARVEPLPGTQWLHADAETKKDRPERVVISFGSEHAPLEQRQVALAIEEAQQLVPKPKIIVFAAFQFDPEAAKDIDETKWPGVMLLKAQMNADLLTEDLKKKRASNESFWLVGQPDVELERIAKGPDAGKLRVSVHGFDYYNTKTGTIESGGSDKIAMWMLDPDYDGRSLFPRQVFFPLAGEKEGWTKLAKNLRVEIDEELIETYRGTVSLAFEAGEHRRVAVKIIDDRGIESLKLIGLD